jgi:Bacterial extracellular solute-binding protein
VDAGRTRRRRRYRPGRKRPARTAALTGLAAAIAVTFLLALSARAIVSRDACRSHPVMVNVAVSTEIAPAIQHIGRYFNRLHRDAAGRCVFIAVRAEPPATVVAQLAGRRSTRHLPRVDAWIPGSDIWTGLARGSAARGQAVLPSGVTVARSALVIVMPRAAAAQTPAFGSSVSWKFLLPHSAGGPAPGLGLHVQFPDPTQSATGLVALTDLQRAFGRGGPARTDLADFVVHTQIVPASAGLASLVQPAAEPATGTAPPQVTIATEQAVVQFDRAHPLQPLAVRYPAEGSDELTYPYVLTASNHLVLSAAREFGTVLSSPYAASYVRYAGFRSGDATAGDWPGWYGLTRSTPHLLPQQPPGQAGADLREWTRVSLGSRDLILTDISSAMAAPPGRGRTDLEHALAKATGPVLAQFPDSTQMGLWAFPSHVNDGLPYQQLVPIGPLAGPSGLAARRQQISRAVQSAQPVPGSPAPLYGTILAAYRQMLGTYQPRYANTVVVLTAGVDHAPGDISATALLGDLHVLYDPQRPVEVMVVMVGRAGDFHALQQIAAATGGQASAITNRGQLGAAFYGAVAQQLCPPHCVG